MTDTKAPASSISLLQLVSALQSLGIDLSPSHGGHQTQPTTPSATPTVSARISSPWVPTSVAPLAATTPAPDLPQREQNEGTPDKEPAPPLALASTSGEAPSGFVCQHCQQFNVLRSAADTWYTVTAGRSVGVFRGWHRVQPLVSGVPHASYHKYLSEAAATAAFLDAKAEGVVVVIM